MKVVIIHGIADNQEDKSYNSHWMKWIKNKLNKENIECIIVSMPDPWAPDYYFWKEEFEQMNIDEDDILIGHSAGCSFLVRYLGETELKVDKLILVAPWKIQSIEFSEGENEMYDFKINRRISKNVKKIIVFTSNNEDNDGKESAKIYKDFLKAELIELENNGHYSLRDMGTEEFPELLKEILSDSD